MLPVGLTVALVGCTSDWGESYLKVNYNGPDRGKVTACAEPPVGAISRDDPSAPGAFQVNDIEVTDTASGEWEVAAVTNAGKGDYAWTCRVTIDAETRTLSAELGSFTGATR